MHKLITTQRPQEDKMTDTTTTAQADPLMKGWARLMRQHMDSCAKPACGLCAEYGHEAAAK